MEMIRLFKLFMHYVNTCQQDAGAPILILILFFSPLFADIKSKTGEIIIDTNSDGKSDLLINSTGLAIGDNLLPAANLHVSGNIVATSGITIGDNVAGTSTLNIGGSFGMHTTTISTNVTLDTYGLNLVNSTTGDVTVTLPAVEVATGRIYTVKKLVPTNSVTIDGGGNNIDTTSSFTLSADDTAYMSVISDGSTWFIIDQSDTGIQQYVVVAAASMVGWYKFDEGGGSTLNDSSNTLNHGTITSATWTSGAIGSALEFDGSNDQVVMPSESALNFGTGDFSFSVWANSDTTSGYRIVFGTDEGGSARNWILSINGITSGGEWNFFDLSDNRIRLTSTSTVSTGQWTHIAITRSGSTARMYINNVLEATDTSANANYGENNPLYIGRRNQGGAQFWDGKIDDLRIFNSELTTDEIQELYNQGP